MKEAAKDDPRIAARVELFDHRVREDYDFGKAPDGLHNLIDSPEYQEEIGKMRNALAAEMKATDDPALEAFLVRDEPAKLDEFMKLQK